MKRFILLTALALVMSVAPMSAQSVSRQRTISITTVSTGGTIPAGKHYVMFQTSAGWTGTVGGVTIAASTKVEFPYLRVDTYGPLAYTVSAGSATLTTF
jgi:hypothetical protein